LDHLRILLIEDSELDAELCVQELRQAGLDFDANRVCTRAMLERALATEPPHVILCDFSMPTDLDGMLALGIARERDPDMPFVFVSGTIGEERAVEAMKAGATDYVLKDRLERLAPVVRRALKEAEARHAKADAEVALRVSEARFRSFMEYLPGNASIADAEGRYTFVNELWEKTFGLPAERVLGRRHEEIAAEALVSVPAHYQEVLKHNRPIERLTRTGSNGEARWWLSHHFPIPAADGRSTMVGTIAIDVTERKLQEEKIARLSRIHAVLSGINSAIVRLRDTTQLLHEACRIAHEDGGFGVAWVGTIDAMGAVTPAACVGLTAGDPQPSALVITGKPDAGGVVTQMLQSGEPAICNDLRRDISRHSARRREAVRQGCRSLVALPLTMRGRVVGVFCLYAMEVNAFTAEELKLLMQLAGDVSYALEYIENERKLDYLAWHDPVTGAGNRERLRDRLDRALAERTAGGGSLAVLVWDMKRFRTINDTFGRDKGDELLRELAVRSRKALPRVEDVGRISADVFGGYIRDIGSASEVAGLLEQAALVFGEPFQLQGAKLAIGITAGVAVSPADGITADVLLANAEAALRQAKGRGERFVFYEPAMSARVAEKLTLESKLRVALDKEQFVLHYQPKVDLASNEVKGVEALIRWNDPETGLVPPMKFIPLLEESGLILEVGRWAIARAVEDWRSRTSAGLPTPRVAVNVSSVQLRRSGFVDVVASTLGGHPLGHGIDLEITESLLMEDIEENIGKLRSLKEMGINIAIDDFGTGYSSLSYLARLPVDALKIDRLFVRTMLDKPESMTIITTIISLAHALRLQVVAEGVESREEAKLLRLLQCDQAQGYTFSRPVPWDECFKAQ